MIVSRRTFVVKPGHAEDAKWLLQDSLRVRPAESNHPVRRYAISIGPGNLWAQEVEYENLAEYEQLSAKWLANLPPEWWKKWNEVVDSGGSIEIWTLLE